MTCKHWLEKQLAAGPMWYRKVKYDAARAGFSQGELRQAKTELDVRAIHPPAQNGRRNPAIFWGLPPEGKSNA